jgi:hypothetical protein
MSGLPPERRLAKFLGAFSFGLGAAQLAAPERVNELIGLEDTERTRTIQRLAGVQEITAAQGIFSFSPPTPILWTRVVGDVLHLGLLGKALSGRRNDTDRLRRAIAAVAGITLLDVFVSARYQSRWPKEPTGVEPLPNTRAHDPALDAHVEGNPAITILASEEEIRPRLQELGVDRAGTITFRKAPRNRGTEVVVATKKTEKVKADLRRVKQLIEVGEIVRSDASPEGAEPKRQVFQRAARPLKEKELSKVGGRS